jgi:DNA-binding MarR family transcriptional regulator
MGKEWLETISYELAVLIRHATSIASNKKFGNLDRAAYLLLHQISTHGSAGVKTLANDFDLDISTVSRQAGSLEKKGYLSRKPDPTDGRAYTLHMTELGTKELSLYKQERLQKMSELFNHWTEEERESFGKLLIKFNRNR